MIIKNNKAVILNYSLFDSKNNLLDQTQDSSFTYLHGHQNIVAGLESALEGKQVGYTAKIEIAPENAYGLRDESKVEEVSKEMFPSDEEIKVGMQFHAEGPDKQLITINILEVNENSIKIDGNDPLAGKALIFDIEIMGIRDASESEVSHGHIHGESCSHDH